MRLVVDASLAAKWIVEEQDSGSAERFLDRYRGSLVAPDLFLIEVAGVVVRLANQRLLDLDEAEGRLDAVELWNRSTVVLYRVTPELATASARLAIELGHPIKDCVYLALAMQLGCPLATCDIRFRDRAVGRYPAIKPLNELVS